MEHRLSKAISAQWLAEQLNCQLYGEPVNITSLASLGSAIEGSLSFAKDADMVAEDLMGAIIFAPSPCDETRITTLKCDNPRLAFSKALNIILAHTDLARAHQEPVIHPSVKLGQNVVIEPGVEIGEGCEIRHNSVIMSGTIIGKNCLIQPSAVVGEEGFSFERDEKGVPIKMPNIGRLIIGDNVQIGALSSIIKGSLDDTIIGNNTKIDNLVHYGHNVVSDENVIITACSIFSGGVKLEKDTWIGPNTSIIQRCTVGEGAFVGIGANVTKSVEPRTVVAGNPAKKIRTL